jgi:thymidylate kinase
MVHQAGKIKDKEERNKFLTWLWDLEFNLYKIPKPDKVFFLNMPIEFVEELIKNRKNKFNNNQVKDIHERDEGHLRDSHQSACEVAKEYNWNEIKCVINGKLRTREDIGEEIFKAVKEIL